MTVRRLVADMRNDAASESAQTPGPRPMLGGTTYSFWKSAARSGGLWVAQRSQRSLCITLKWERVTSAFQKGISIVPTVPHRPGPSHRNVLAGPPTERAPWSSWP